MNSLNNFGYLLNRLETVDSSNSKQIIIKIAIEKHPDFKQFFELALSPYITFGVAKLPTEATLPVQPEYLDPMYVLDHLACRKLTGLAAQSAIFHLRADLEFDECEAFDCILLKDLQCGIGAAIVNKAVPGTVPVFSCQLAPSKMPELSELIYPIAAEPKFDGVRMIAIKKVGVVRLFSRNGLLFENFSELETALAYMPDDFVFDGEVISSSGFQMLMKRTKAARGKNVDVPIEYVVFDGMPLDEWEKQSCTRSYRDRTLGVERFIFNMSSDYVRVTSFECCQNIQDVEDFYREQVELGLEGIMLKGLDSSYTFARNKSWMKLKPFKSADLSVVNMIEGTGKYKGSLGALVLKGEHDGHIVTASVGSGFSDEERMSIWNEKPISKMVEVRYQEITETNGEHSLRFPSFSRWRPDLLTPH